MRTVTRFEAELLQMTRGILRQSPAQQLLGQMRGGLARPPGLSADCLWLLEDFLRKGIVRILAREGGWLRERYLVEGQVRSGRLWDRTSPAALTLRFSQHAIEFLLWLRTSGSGEGIFRHPDGEEPPTVAEEFLVFLAYRTFRKTDVGARLLEQPLLAANALARVTFPEDFRHVSGRPGLDLSPWFGPRGAPFLESLQPLLMARWLDVERSKRTIRDPREMLGIGARQEEALTGVLNAADQFGRRDLARFVLRALAELVVREPDASAWMRHVAVAELKTAERVDVARAATTFLRAARRLQDWAKHARTVGYLDGDGYRAAQLWLADWERFQGESACRKALDLARQLEPLNLA